MSGLLNRLEVNDEEESLIIAALLESADYDESRSNLMENERLKKQFRDQAAKKRKLAQEIEM